MAIYSGLTADSAKHLQLDAGAFLIDYNPATDTYATATEKILGCTVGGGSFAAVPTIRQVDVDGKKGAVKGFEILDEWTITLTATVKEITAKSLKVALATGRSASEAAPSGYTKITATSEIAASDYMGNVAWVGKLSGSQQPIIIIVKNALATNGLNMSMADKSEGNVAITLTGHYDLSDLETPPFEIHYPPIP